MVAAQAALGRPAVQHAGAFHRSQRRQPRQAHVVAAAAATGRDTAPLPQLTRRHLQAAALAAVLAMQAPDAQAVG